MIEPKPRRRRGEGKATTVCPECGKEFVYDLSWPRKYCSLSCRGKNTVANIKHFAPTKHAVICEQCGKEFEATAKRTRGRFCSQRCWGNWLSIHNRGAANPVWRGGGALYYGGTWKKMRRVIRARDKVCQMCGKTPEENGGALDVHHIIPLRLFANPDEANTLNNLTALCSPCHDIADKTYNELY